MHDFAASCLSLFNLLFFAVCSCKKRLVCCSHQGFVLHNQALLGKIYQGVAKKEDCWCRKSLRCLCNLLTNSVQLNSSKCFLEPACGSWEYSDKHVCVLKKGPPDYRYLAQLSTSGITTWAGPRISGTRCDKPSAFNNGVLVQTTHHFQPQSVHRIHKK